MTEFYSHVSRCLERRNKLLGFEKFQSFYAIAAMNNWKDVVTEQKEVCDSLGINPICSLLGTVDDKKWVEDQGLNIGFWSENLHEYETPALELLYKWSCDNPLSAVLYFHTKGVSAPQDDIKKYWRWLMTDYLIVEYETNLKKLELCDMVGVSWMEEINYPHFCGNFWMARCDWINTLINPREYRNNGGPNFWMHPWDRMHAEMWIGSKGHHQIESLCCTNGRLWEDNIHYERYKGINKYEKR
jgi:hypothetical protein